MKSTFMGNKRVEAKKIEDRWYKIRENIINFEKADEDILIIGDLNKAVGDGKYGVKGNHSKVSYGGTLIHQLLSTEKYVLLNNSDKAKGGPFTRIDPADENSKSCLDLAIASKHLSEFIHELVIDWKRRFIPHMAISKNKLCYADHLSMYVKFKDIPVKQIENFKEPKKIIWNTNKIEGWEKYKDLTDTNETLLTLVDKSENTTEMMGKFDKIMTKIKFKSFG